MGNQNYLKKLPHNRVCYLWMHGKKENTINQRQLYNSNKPIDEIGERCLTQLIWQVCANPFPNWTGLSLSIQLSTVAFNRLSLKDAIVGLNEAFLHNYHAFSLFCSSCVPSQRRWFSPLQTTMSTLNS